MFKVVVFDIDGTLATPKLGSSWLDLTDGLGANCSEHLAIYNASSKGDISIDEAKEKLFKIWKEKGKILKSRVKEIFEAIPLRGGAEETVKYLKNKGYILCLITGSSELFAEIVARKLGVEYYFANTTFKWNDEGELEDFHYVLNQRGKKLEQLEGFVESKGILLEECVAVGSGMSDRLLFEKTGHGVAIDSGPGSEGIREYAWKTIKELPELKSIL